ncbi:putative acyltransferase [Terriglobus roseus DSM 18391]|uniref:Putative acyltransferase n=1 Tax=Terriglobus roseus (strain DSM 18391 / NRRL B-41598 / KBS 63) TaxID=926566 RepID=I3ZFY4_TERRK|nr:acyltransferase [Terriglobus roseus]AFL88152.1 putative acyltransferase [Terriglobus roseus DSM 18391]
MSPQPVPRPRLPHILELDGLRGIAALLVFFHHLSYVSITPTHGTFLIKTMYSLTSLAYGGVDLFFVLSGFLITNILIGERESKRYYKDFYWKRALRIFPLYVACLAFLLMTYPASWKYVVLALLFIANLSASFHVVALGPFWTLAIEEQFYILWPTVVRRRKIDHLQKTALGIVIACILLRLVAAHFGHHNYGLTPLRCDGLAGGALLACWWTRRGSPQGASLKENSMMAACFFIGVLLLLPEMTSLRAAHAAYFAAMSQTGLTLIALSVVAHIVSHTNASWLAWARSRALTFMGLISYAFYMIHGYVYISWDRHHDQLFLDENGPYLMRLVTVLAATIMLAVLSRYIIELPAQRLRKYVLPKH